MNGIARIQGFAIFVKGAKAGGHVRIKVINVGNKFAKDQIVSRSPEGEEKKGKAE